MVTISATIDEGEDAHRLVRVGAWDLTLWEITGDGEPRIRDIDVAERLGFSRPRKIRDLIRRVWPGAKIRKIFSRPTVGRTSMPRGGHRETRVDEFWLTEAQLLKVIARSETPIADVILDDMIRVYIAVRRGLLAEYAPAGRAASRSDAELSERMATAIAPLQRELAELRGWMTAVAQVAAPHADDAEPVAPRSGVSAAPVREAPVCGWNAITETVARALGVPVCVRTVQRYAHPGRLNRLPVFQYDSGGVYLMPSALDAWTRARSVPLGAR